MPKKTMTESKYDWQTGGPDDFTFADLMMKPEAYVLKMYSSATDPNVDDATIGSEGQGMKVKDYMLYGSGDRYFPLTDLPPLEEAKNALVDLLTSRMLIAIDTRDENGIVTPMVKSIEIWDYHSQRTISITGTQEVVPIFFFKAYPITGDSERYTRETISSIIVTFQEIEMLKVVRPSDQTFNWFGSIRCLRGEKFEKLLNAKDELKAIE